MPSNLSNDHNIKVLPIYIYGANSLFENKSLTPKKGHIHLEILEPISIADDETVEEFSIRAREFIKRKKLYRRKSRAIIGLSYYLTIISSYLQLLQH